MKKILEIKREDTIIRIEIPQISEDFLLLAAVTIIFCTFFSVLASVM